MVDPRVSTEYVRLGLLVDDPETPVLPLSDVQDGSAALGAEDVLGDEEVEYS